MDLRFTPLSEAPLPITAKVLPENYCCGIPPAGFKRKKQKTEVLLPVCLLVWCSIRDQTLGTVPARPALTTMLHLLILLSVEVRVCVCVYV